MIPKTLPKPKTIEQGRSSTERQPRRGRGRRAVYCLIHIKGIRRYTIQKNGE